nr:reverse transcriptase domain-containing protein [Tanacetum cinerariifolium]
MADRTMEELLQAPSEGYGEAIVIPEILAENFEIKMNLLQLVQANNSHGRENDNPHTHICNFKRMTATLKYRDVPNDAIKLMLFPNSLEDRARICYEKEPPNSILTWEDLVNKFVNQFFPPSKTTHLKNEISRFTQRSDETFIDIVNKQVVTPAKSVEKVCVTYGGAHAYYECIATDSNPSSICAAIGSYNQVSPPNRASHQIPPPGFASVQNNPNRFNQNQGQENYFNQGNNFKGNHFQNNQGYRSKMNNVSNFQNQGFQNQPFSVPNNQIPPSVPNELSSYIKSNEIAIKTMQNQINVLRGDFNKQEQNLRRNLNDDMRNILRSFFQNQPSTSGTLSSNTIPNPKGEMKVVTTCSGLAYEELTQIDTFYNGLTEQDQDSLNAASGGNLLNKTTREALQIIENKSKVRYSRSRTNIARVNTNSRDVVSKTDDRIDKLANQISNLVDIVNKQVVAPAKAVKKVCVTCRGAHAYYECIATDSNPSSICSATGSYNQVSLPNRASHQIPPPGFVLVQNNPNMFNQDQGQGNYFNQGNNFK